MIGLSYCTCVFLVTQPFTWFHNFLPCDLYREIWPSYEKHWPWLLFNDGCHLASVFVFWQLLFIICDRVSMFGMHTHLIKPFQMTPGSRTFWPWPLILIQLVSEIQIPRQKKIQKLWERIKSLETLVKGYGQCHKVDDLGANWKGFTSWVCIPNKKFLSLMVMCIEKDLLKSTAKKIFNMKCLKILKHFAGSGDKVLAVAGSQVQQASRWS